MDFFARVVKKERGMMRKAKAQLELNLATEVRNSKAFLVRRGRQKKLYHS